MLHLNTDDKTVLYALLFDNPQIKTGTSHSVKISFSNLPVATLWVEESDPGNHLREKCGYGTALSPLASYTLLQSSVVGNTAQVIIIRDNAIN